jgi:hypothetical protein
LTLAGGYVLTGSGAAQVVQGNYWYSANPAFGTTFADRDALPYLSIEGGQAPNSSATLATPSAGDREMSFYIGSLDRYNTITFVYKDGKSETFDGTTIANAISTTPNNFPYGDQQSSRSNGLLTFLFDSPVTDVVFGSEGTNAFEIANISAVAAPEPATWAMMMMGLGAVGVAMRSRRKLAAATV